MKRYGFPSSRSARVSSKLLVLLALAVCVILVGIWLQLSGGDTKASSGGEGDTAAAQPTGPTLLVRNGNFEADIAGDPPSGWTTYIQAGKRGEWTIQTVQSPEGVQWQQTQVIEPDSWGGLRQEIVGLTSGKTYTISGTYRTNSVSATAAVRYSLHGGTDRDQATLLVGTSNPEWEDFSDTVTAIGGTITLFLDHSNGTRAEKVSAFDNIIMTPDQ